MGWLAGLSTAPVIAIIITSLVGSISALVAGAAGIQGTGVMQRSTLFEEARALRVNPAPLALLVTGLLIGSSVGIVARSHNWLGVGLEAQIRQWTDLGLDRADVVQRYFSNASGPTTVNTPAPSHVDTVLFSSVGTECRRLLALDTRELPAALDHSSEPSLTRLRDIIELERDPLALYGALFIACNFDVRARSQ